MKNSVLKYLSLSILLLTPLSAPAHSASLTVYCGFAEEWCSAQVNAFQRETGTDVAMIRKSAGEIFAQVQAEASNPKADIWLAGSNDGHLQAAKEGLTEEYRSPMLKDLQPWAVKQAERSGYRTVGLSLAVMGFAYNADLIAEKKLTVPKCWADLLRPEYKGEIQTSNPNSSGAAYMILATIDQLFGQEKGTEYLKELDRNINQYTKSGGAPTTALVRGETTISISTLHNFVPEIAKGYPIKVVVPCEGTGYDVSGISIIKGAPNLDAAKAFYDWALGKTAQETGSDIVPAIPANVNAAIPADAPDISKYPLIEFDFQKYGSAETREVLIRNWNEQVGDRR